MATPSGIFSIIRLRRAAYSDLEKTDEAEKESALQSIIHAIKATIDFFLMSVLL